MAGLLGDILSDNKAKQADWQSQVNAYGSGLKSKLMGLLQDPAGSLNQFANHLGEQVDRNSDLMNQAGWMPIAKTNATKEQRDMARALLADQGAQGSMAGMIDQKALKGMFPNVDFSLMQKGNQATLSKVVVPKDARGQGVGTGFMQALTDAADADGTQLALSPSADFGGNKNRLVQFYKQFGFVPNKGRNIDFSISESMRREPTGLLGN